MYIFLPTSKKHADIKGLVRYLALCYAETSPAILWTFLVCNVLTDIYLTVLPMPMLWRTSLAKPTKLALIFLFGCGFLVAIAAILRAALVASVSTYSHLSDRPILSCSS